MLRSQFLINPIQIIARGGLNQNSQQGRRITRLPFLAQSGTVLFAPSVAHSDRFSLRPIGDGGKHTTAGIFRTGVNRIPMSALTAHPARSYMKVFRFHQFPTIFKVAQKCWNFFQQFLIIFKKVGIFSV